MRTMIITIDPRLPDSDGLDSVEMRFIDRSVSTSDDDEQGIRDFIDPPKQLVCHWCGKPFNEDSLDSLRYAVRLDFQETTYAPSYFLICEACEPSVSVDTVVEGMAILGGSALKK